MDRRFSLAPLKNGVTYKTDRKQTAHQKYFLVAQAVMRIPEVMANEIDPNQALELNKSSVIPEGQVIIPAEERSD